MLRAVSSAFRTGLNPFQLQQCMNISTTKTAYFAAALPQPQTNPDILYTGVSLLMLFYAVKMQVMIRLRGSST